jgi:hypothetical protein
MHPCLRATESVNTTVRNHDVPASFLSSKTLISTTITHLHMLTCFTPLEHFGILPE